MTLSTLSTLAKGLCIAFLPGWVSITVAVIAMRSKK